MGNVDLRGCLKIQDGRQIQDAGQYTDSCKMPTSLNMSFQKVSISTALSSFIYSVTVWGLDHSFGTIKIHFCHFNKTNSQNMPLSYNSGGMEAVQMKLG